MYAYRSSVLPYKVINYYLMTVMYDRILYNN